MAEAGTCKQNCASSIRSFSSILSVNIPQPKQGAKLKPELGGAKGTAKILGEKRCAGAINTTKEFKPRRILSPIWDP